MLSRPIGQEEVLELGVTLAEILTNMRLNQDVNGHRCGRLPARELIGANAWKLLWRPLLSFALILKGLHTFHMAVFTSLFDLLG
jgi:hypothetical protein